MQSAFAPAIRVYTSARASGVVGLGEIRVARLGWFIVLLAGSVTAGAQSRDRTPVVAPKHEIAGEAQATATRGLPRIGDTWTYRLDERPRDGKLTVQRSYVVKVKASSGTSLRDEVTRGSAAPVETTHSPGRYMVEQVVSVFSPYLVVFEDLNPGDRIWRVSEHDEDSCFGWLYCWTTGRVEGRETLELPAGSFDTIKVTIDQNIQRRSPHGGQPGSRITTRTLTIWYSPQAKRAVKVTSRVSSGVRTPFFTTYDLELVSYQLQ
jgi:hypothetical protein